MMSCHPMSQNVKIIKSSLKIIKSLGEQDSYKFTLILGNNESSERKNKRPFEDPKRKRDCPQR